jgi:hypothetical protein
MVDAPSGMNTMDRRKKMLSSRNKLDKFETVALDITHLLEKNNIDLNSAKHILWSILYSCYGYEFLEERASKRFQQHLMSTKCVCYGSWTWRMMKMADGERDELTEVLELFDHALPTGIRTRIKLSRLCKSEPSGFETERNGE